MAHHSSSLKSLLNWKNVLLGTLSSACWGISTVISKDILETVSPLSLLVIQLISSNVLLWAIVWIQGVVLPPFYTSVKLGLPGLLQPGLAFITGIIGLSLTHASVEALIWSTETLLIIGLAWVILKERVGWPLVRLSLLGVLGVILVSVTGSSALGTGALWGNLLIFVGTFCAALYTVLVRQGVQNRSPLAIVTLNQSVGLAGVALVWLVSLGWVPATLPLNWQTWFAAMASGLMLHALPFWLFTILLKRVKASLAGLFLILIPLFTISGASLFLGETLSTTQWIGAGLILLTMSSVSVLYKE